MFINGIKYRAATNAHATLIDSLQIAAWCLIPYSRHINGYEKDLYLWPFQSVVAYKKAGPIL